MYFLLFVFQGFIRDPSKKLNKREIFNIFQYCDIDGSGNLDLGEFMFNIIVSNRSTFKLLQAKIYNLSFTFLDFFQKIGGLYHMVKLC